MNMPKAILAMRSYPATLLLALLLFLATLLITASSLGKVRSGGDGGDGGSGMGGTGKSGEFGGSGFGGTGGPSPFLTTIEQDDEHEQETLSPDLLNPFEESTPTMIVQEAVQSTPIAVPKPVQQAIAEHPLVEQTRQEIARGATDTDSAAAKEAATPLTAPPLQGEDLLVPVKSESRLALITVPEETTLQIAALPEVATPLIDDSANAQDEALRDSPQLAETITVILDSDAQDAEQQRQRSARPERIQRPELPPFQRIRPVERPAMLPPRVQPMRI